MAGTKGHGRDDVDDWISHLRSKLTDRAAVVGVVGLGYVGLPLSVEFAKRFKVYGFEVSSEIVKNLEKGKSHIEDIPDATLKPLVGKSLFPTLDEQTLRKCDFIVVSVPTPLTEAKEPDLKPVESAGNIIARNLRKGQFVVLESTTYPGTTREVFVPLLEKSGLTPGTEFGVAYSPERLDPGNKRYHTANTPKVVGGITPPCTELAAQLFSTIVERVVTVSSCEAAEACKMLENVFRAVNIALINEMALTLDRMGIDTWEVIEAAATKPYGFMSFYPGPGIGGHCIPLDPFYMSYRAKQVGVIARFIELSGEINEFMKFHTVNLLVKGLERAGKAVRTATVAVFGVSYKKDIRDTRESPARKIITELHRRGCAIRIYDPIAEMIETDAGSFRTATSADIALRGADAVLFLTDHSVFREFGELEYGRLMRGIPVIIDTRNVLGAPPPNTIYLGLGKGSKPN